MTCYKDGLYPDMSNADYHGTKGVYSSSQLKTILDDEELFFKKYISGEIKGEKIDAFDTGTYFHTKVLEPHLLEEECAVYHGKVKRGKEWNDFKMKHEGKAILNLNQAETAEKLADAVAKSEVAMATLEGCKVEMSAFVTVLVELETGRIFNTAHTLELKEATGWKTVDFGDEPTGELLEVQLKVRADAISTEGEFKIADLKSSTGNVKNTRDVKKKISMYEYDLSAAMYLDLFSLALDQNYQNFYWIFASKDTYNCKTWLATPLNIRVGRAKWMKAVWYIAIGIKKNWAIEDTLGTLDPEQWQVQEWIKGDR